MSYYDLGYREVIPDQTLPEKWREFTLNTGGTQSTLQDIKVPERAGGYSYIDTSKIVTRNRFIYWRICHDVLELVEQSLDINLVGNQVKFRFQDTPILEGVSVKELYSNVVVLVPTVSSVHRLVFPHPDKIYNKDLLRHHPQNSIFADAGLASNNQQHAINHTAANAPLPHTAATHLNSAEDAIFTLAYSTGVTLLIKMDNLTRMIASVELKQSSIMNRLWTGLSSHLLRGRNHEEEVPCSMVLHTLGLETYLFTLGQDCRLRMWSCSRAECIIAVDVLETTTEQRSTRMQGHQTHLLRKATGSTVEDLYLGCFLSFAEQSIFVVLRPILEQGLHNVERLYTTFDSQGDLVDFLLSASHIWAMWSNANGDTVIKHRYMDHRAGPGRQDWLEVKQEVPPARTIEPNLQSNQDPRQAYLSYIFHPGQFPLSVINRALTIYRRPTGGLAPTLLPEVSASVLRERVAVAVETEITAEVHEQELTTEEYLDVAWRCWSRFYSCCIQYYWAGTRPIAFLAGTANGGLPSPLPGCPLGLVRKSQFSLFRPVDEIEHMFVIGTEGCEMMASTVDPMYDEDILDESMVQLISALVMIENQLTQDIKDSFLQDLHHLQSPDIIVNKLQQIHNEEDVVLFPRPFLTSLFARIDKDVVNQSSLRLLQAFALDDNPGTSMDLDADDIPREELESISHMFSSQLGQNIVAESLHQSCNTRFSILRNLLFLLKYILQKFWMYFPPEDSNRQTSEMIRSMLIPRCTVLIQGYYVINWIALVPCASVAPSMLEASMQQLSVMSVSERNEYLAPKSQRTITLLSMFLASKSVRYAHNLMAQKRPDEDALSQWHTSLLPFTTTIGKLVWPLSTLFVFPEFLLASCQYLLIQEYVRLLETWCDCNVFSRQFLMGTVLLDMGESEKACDLLLISVEGVNTEEFLNFHLGQQNDNDPEPSDEHRHILYYLKVIKMFEQMDHSDCVLRVADEAIINAEPGDPELPTLHSIKFSHLLRIGRHEKAFDAMVCNPDAERRRDSLRQLINSLVETCKLTLLITLPFGELLQDVEEILLAKARSQDMLTSNYYTILHSLHITKSNYRKGATVMYEQALRLNQELVGLQSLERQVRCSLACINNLSLVSEQYRWVLKPTFESTFDSSRSDELPGASPKRNYDGDELHQVPRKRTVEIIELPDIKKEYEVALAKLSLVNQDASQGAAAGVAHLSVGQLIGVLATAGRYDTALRLSAHYDLVKVNILESLVERCVHLTREETSDVEWIKLNNTADLRRMERSMVDVAWKYLQHILYEHEEGNATVLHRALVCKLITLQSFIPQWLADTYKLRHPAELLRTLLSAGRLEEAGMLSVELYQAGLGIGYTGLKCPSVQTRSCSTWLPHNILERAIAELDCAVKDNLGEPYESLLEKLCNLRGQYYEKVQQKTQEMCTHVERQFNPNASVAMTT